MEKILYITDYIEGIPVIASVRYQELVDKLSNKYKIYVVNDIAYGDKKSKFSIENYTFNSLRKNIFNVKESTNKKSPNKIKAKVKSVLKKPYKLFTFSKQIFKMNNKVLFKDLDRTIKCNNINKVFVTVPDIYGLYIVEELKKRHPELKVVIEIRDTVYNDLSIKLGIPETILKKAEDIIYNYGDKIICLSEGIYDYYVKKIAKDNIYIIKNGYNETLFKECKYNKIDLSEKKEVIFAHVGSIYSGRNVKEFIKALADISKELNQQIIFNIVGYLDDIAQQDVKDALENTNNVKVNVLGLKAHEEAIRYIKNSDINVILTHVQGSEFAIPGKTFEYIGSCKPIIAITKDKPLINIINNQYGECAEHTYTNIKEKILKIYNTEYSFENIDRYSREEQANAINKVIEDL